MLLSEIKFQLRLFDGALHSKTNARRKIPTLPGLLLFATQLSLVYLLELHSLSTTFGTRKVFTKGRFHVRINMTVDEKMMRLWFLLGALWLLGTILLAIFLETLAL